MLGSEKAQALIEQLQKKYPKMGLEAAFIDKADNMVQTEGMNIPVSYTHLDVYKRQVINNMCDWTLKDAE